MTRELSEAEIEALADEAERGYCTEFLENKRPCLEPAVAEINVGRNGKLACKTHVKIYDDSVIRMLT